MGSVLAKFWLRRYAMVFVLACVGLGAVELIQHDRDFSFGTVLGWSAIAAVFASSVATYWAYQRQCRQVFKPPTDDNVA